MKLIDLLPKFTYNCLKGSVDIAIAHLVYDSRKVAPGMYLYASAVQQGTLMTLPWK